MRTALIDAYASLSNFHVSMHRFFSTINEMPLCIFIGDEKYTEPSFSFDCWSWRLELEARGELAFLLWPDG
jgi:hypothetical protein